MTDRSPRLVMRQKIAPGHFLPLIAVHWQLFTPSVFHQNFHFLLLLSLGNSLLLPTSSLNLLPDLGHNNIGIWHYNALGRMFLTALTELYNGYHLVVTFIMLSFLCSTIAGHCYWIKNSIDKQWDAIRKQLKIMTASLPCTCDSLGAKTSPCKDTSVCHLKQNFTEFCVAGRAALSVVYTAAGGRTAGGGGSCQRCRLLLFHRSDHLGFELPTHQHTLNCRQYEWKLVKGCYSLIYMKSHISLVIFC